MDITQIGILTHHTRVERWQCDFNDHWNARFHGRAFQCAAETAATLHGGENPGAGVITARHIRYHRELRLGAAVEVRSAVIRDTAANGAVAHLLTSAGQLCAVAIDHSPHDTPGLPEIDGAALERQMPRNLSSPKGVKADEAGTVFHCEVGPVRPAELDHVGGFVFEDIMARGAVSVHTLLLGLGYTMEFTEQTGIGRMAIELSLARHGEVTAGTVLIARARLSAVNDKSFCVDHWLGTRAGRQVATIRQTLVAVDMRARRITRVPDFILEQAPI